MNSQSLTVDQLDLQVRTVHDYHNRTKHHFHRYAASLGYMDWANQPDPFRTFEGSERILFPLMEEDTTPSYDSIYNSKSPDPSPVDLRTLAQFFELALALSAWKEYQGNRWSLRIDPSSGNLHPTEGYLVIDPTKDGESLAALGEDGMVCHYRPKDHGLDVRTRFTCELWNELMDAFPSGSFLIGLTSIYWREAWKYGERAFRYCQHDTGHCLATCRISASILGWKLIHLQDMADSEIAALLGLDREEDFRANEREEPELLTVVVPGDFTPESPLRLPASAIERIAAGEWSGKANPLSSEHQKWQVIEEVSKATVKPETSLPLFEGIAFDKVSVVPKIESDGSDPKSARQIVFQRRSAVAMDGKTDLPAERFFLMLARTLPWAMDGYTLFPPWDTVGWRPCVHLALFVHRVVGIPPGLYCLVRDPNKKEALQESMRKEFAWTRPEGCPENLPLNFLLEGDCRVVAGQLSCMQDIAAAGAFSLGMFSEFRESLQEYGPWHYRRLFWETGMIGQVLYLEAEAAGIRSTGIGCFFDDPVHEFFGIGDNRFQSLYHFTVGGPVEDARLSTLPPYTAEQRNDPDRLKIES